MKKNPERTGVKLTEGNTLTAMFIAFAVLAQHSINMA